MSLQQVWVIGYYHNGNLGDDVFGWIYQNIIPNVKIINSDAIPLEVPTTVRAIIVGGGDLVNDYFMQQLKPLMNCRRTCPIYAVGIGIPYPKLIDQGYLDGFDYIIHRTAIDHPLLVDRYKDNVYYSPDIAWLSESLTAVPPVEVAAKFTPPCFLNRAPTIRRIGVFLARPMYSEHDPTCYERIVQGIAKFLHGLATQGTLKGNNNNNGGLKLTRRQKKNRKRLKMYHIDLVPFGTNLKKPSQDDRIMNRDVLAAITQLQSAAGGDPLVNISVYEHTLEISTLVDFFRQYDYTLCSRFHSHVYSFIAKVPVMSVSCTRKVTSLMMDAKMDDYLYALPVNPQHLYPLECSHVVLSAIFDRLVKNELAVRTHLQQYAEENRAKITITRLVLKNLLFYLPQPVTRFLKMEPARQVAEFLVSNRSLLSQNGGGATTTSNMEYEIVPCGKGAVASNAQDVEHVLETGGIGRLGLTESDTDRVVRIISFLLTGAPVSTYSWGLKEQLRWPSYNLRESCDWIWKHRRMETQTSEEFPEWKRLNRVLVQERNINLEYARPCDLNGDGSVAPKMHRSGWSYVNNDLKYFHNPDVRACIFDSYLDETFGWRYQVLRDVGILPFRKQWRGILHHTPNTDFSENNLVRLFARRGWVRSLPTCQGIYTLSKSLSQWVHGELIKLGHGRIPVITLIHPTETPVIKFQWNMFMANSHKRIIQVGGWLRNTFAIYNFPTYVQSHGFIKTALKGRGMDHYYINKEQFDTWISQVDNAFTYNQSGSGGGGGVTNMATPNGRGVNQCYNNILETTPSCLFETGRGQVTGTATNYQTGSGGITDQQTGGTNQQLGIVSATTIVSPWIINARADTLTDMRNKYQSVDMLEFVNDDEYDNLLASNVVFLNLLDCSAVNTIIECIVRNTPLLVNPLPAVCEYLGPAYPLYYTSLDHAAELLIDTVKLYAAHVYLKRMDKSRLKIDTFISELQSSLDFNEYEWEGIATIRAK